MTLLAVEHLRVGFGQHAVVQDVSFTIEPGESLALVGESGCGKSLTAFALLQLLPHGAAILGGQIRLNGAPMVGAPARTLRAMRGKQVALILQEPMSSLNPVLTIGRQIAEMIRQHETLSRAAVQRRVVELLDLVGIRDPALRADDYPHQFSGGMRQRVMIATAIACNPALLIADEPTTALDVTIQAQILDLLDGLRRQLGMAVLLISHDLGLVGDWADRVAVMYAGRIVEQAPAEAFVHAPVHPYARGLLGATVGQDAGWHYTTHRLQEIPGSVASAAGQPGCAFAPRCPEAIPACRIAPPVLQPCGPGWAAACIVNAPVAA